MISFEKHHQSTLVINNLDDNKKNSQKTLADIIQKIALVDVNWKTSLVDVWRKIFLVDVDQKIATTNISQKSRSMFVKNSLD